MQSGSRERHGVLVTFQRPSLLIDHLDALRNQTAPLDSLTIVDNDADPQIEALISEIDLGATTQVDYLPLPGNPGPAGGFTAGIEHVLTHPVDDDDLIVLLDDNDPPRTNQTLADTAAIFTELEGKYDRVGAVGSWGARLHRRGRLRMALSQHPESVHYLAGGGCSHYAVKALRNNAGPDAELFFGFEELDLGMALRREGWTLWSSGMARRHGWGEAMVHRRAALRINEPTWRRYYSLRNLITILRKDGRTLDALIVSVTVGIAKPLANTVLTPRFALANLGLAGRAVLDAWCGRMGKRVDPENWPQRSTLGSA